MTRRPKFPLEFTFGFIKFHFIHIGCPPTVKVISQRFGMANGTVRQQLIRMQTKGWIKWEKGRLATMRVTRQAE